VVALVFDRPARRFRHAWKLAAGGAVGLHLALLFWAVRAEISLETWSAQLAIRVHHDLDREAVVELPPPKPPPATSRERKPRGAQQARGAFAAAQARLVPAGTPSR
jgi:hypothetical protein